jgi:formylglycine-generating enzyme required for sulfatase activity
MSNRTGWIVIVALVVFGVGRPAGATNCPADLDQNGTVNGADLSVLLAQWGPCEPGFDCTGDLTGDSIVDGADLSTLLAEWGSTCSVVIESVSPPSGPLAGGTEITITGQQLGGVQSVTIGGVPATNVVSVDTSTITVVTPPSKSQGPKDVVVTTTASSATLTDGFVYSPLAWALPLEFEPDPEVVTDPEWRTRIIATGLPWRVQDNASGIEMLLVPPGTFDMGCSPSDQWGCNSDENPVHEVTLTQAFYLGRYEVTQAQWTAVMGSNPSAFQSPSPQVPASQVPNRPVERVSWNMIQGFEAETGLRLPTEAEWEYACRAGTDTAFNLPLNGTNDDGLLGQLAWWGSNSASQTRPVGQKQANNLGLHDMHGNVWEWVEDWYGSGYYAQSPSVDPPGPISGAFRVLRGGSWYFSSSFCRASARGGGFPGLDDVDFGFRAARTP